MNAQPRPWHRVLLPLLAASALVLGAVAADAAPGRPSSVRASGGANAVGHARAAVCSTEASSLAPPPGPPQVSSSPFAETILRHGYLIAGVSQSSYHFGFLNPLTGQLEGFDIDMIKAVARAIFGDSNPHRVRWKAITDLQREPDIQSGVVDIVAETMTILCIRVKHEHFSNVYFMAGQRVLVLKDSPARSLAALAGQKVCATAGADSIAVIRKDGAIPYIVPDWTDCLVHLQQGDVAAVSTDDAILYGLQAQDPWTIVVGPQLTTEPYGLAISKQHPDFVRFVNAVLAQMFADGQWAASYAHWIGTPVPPPPQAHYAG